MASSKDAKRTGSGRVTYRGESFSGFNKPKELLAAAKSSRFLLVRAIKLSWYVSAIQT